MAKKDFSLKGSDEHGPKRAEMQSHVAPLVAPLLKAGLGMTLPTAKSRARFVRSVLHELAKLAPKGVDPALFIAKAGGDAGYSLHYDANPAAFEAEQGTGSDEDGADPDGLPTPVALN